MDSRIPPLILGTMTFGDTADETSAADLVRTALDAGIAWFDTANSYSDGLSEEILGRILAGRDDVTIATKVGQPQSLVGTENLLSAAKIRTSIEASLSRLGREHVEILYLHKPDRSTPLDETLSEIAALHSEGKIGAFGVSNYSAWQISDVARVAAEVGAPPILVSQQMYSLLARRLEDEYEEYAVTTGLPTVIYNPLAGGLLTGRYARDADAGSGRFGDARNAREYRARYWDDRMFSAVESLTAIADGAGIPLAEFALRWTLGRPAVQSVLLGGTRVSHLSDNIAAFRRGPLPADVSAAADAVGEELRGPMPAYNR
ncbi:aldo/keto reductase [Mycetocola zhadangensis]|uniref:aldo/keto reductase n=1 Tax=Mycetocola zhadangensis TaxID=1164595 RepID=UPI003A4DE52A